MQLSTLFLVTLLLMSASNLAFAEHQNSAPIMTIAADENVDVKVRTPVGADFEFKKGEPNPPTTTVEKTTVVEKEPAGGCHCDITAETPVSPNYYLGFFILLLVGARSVVRKLKSKS